jgi:transcriptional regulator with XRE-family HTH domain
MVALGATMATSAERRAKFTGRRVAAQRKLLGLSVPDCAGRLGIDRTYLWRIEEGRVTPSLDLLERMAAFFGVTLDELRRPRARAA